MAGLSYAEALVVGAMQGLTELFPVSSLGHSVLLPALVGGGWARDLDVSRPQSPYLAFVVGLHVATAAALLVFFWRDWLRILGGLATSLRYRRIDTADERLAWLIVLATIPVGVAGLLLEHLFRTTLGRPVPAACFLVLNGFVLLAGERLRRQAEPAEPAEQAFEVAQPVPVGSVPPPRRVPAPRRPVDDADARLSRLSVPSALTIGAAQILALLPGISRSGITMVAGLGRGLSHQDSARLSFLLATPVILAAGVLKVPDLVGPLGAGIHGEVLAGSLASFLSALLALRFLTRWFRTRTLTPFAVYCLFAGTAALIVLTVR